MTSTASLVFQRRPICQGNKYVSTLLCTYPSLQDRRSFMIFLKGLNIVLWSVRSHKNNYYTGSGRLIFHTFTLVTAVVARLHNLDTYNMTTLVLI